MMPSMEACNFAILAQRFEEGSVLWTIFGLVSIFTLGFAKGSILDEWRLPSILVASS
jgi:hypothetical protein